MSAAASSRCLIFALLILLIASTTAVPAEKDEWLDLTNFEAWRRGDRNWALAESVAVDADKANRLTFQAGKSILVNGKNGRANDLLSKRAFGDVEVHLEFFIPKGSNSGVKLQGVYEIQIADSWGAKKLKGSDCGGIYPRAELKPRYHHIDDGVPPRVNACKKPGEWQTLDLIFLSPRFGADGKKTANARFVKVVLNDRLIHENAEAKTPTGHVWHDKESASGPLLLQGDHGPVAFRNVRVRPYVPARKKD